MSPNIRISRKTAEYILDLAKRLWYDGHGEHLDSQDDESEIDSGGFINDVPLDNPELLNWAHALLSFARFIAGIVDNALDGDENWDTTNHGEQEI